MAKRPEGKSHESPTRLMMKNTIFSLLFVCCGTLAFFRTEDIIVMEVKSETQKANVIPVNSKKALYQ